MEIAKLVNEARNLARVDPTCADGHDWEVKGGRPCPYGEVGWCSQPVMECARCGELDYGEKNGPGWQDCRDRKQLGDCVLDNLKESKEI